MFYLTNTPLIRYLLRPLIFYDLQYLKEWIALDLLINTEKKNI